MQQAVDENGIVDQLLDLWGTGYELGEEGLGRFAW